MQQLCRTTAAAGESETQPSPPVPHTPFAAPSGVTNERVPVRPTVLPPLDPVSFVTMTAEEGDASQESLLGVVLFAPHYQTEYMSIYVHQSEGPWSVFERVRHLPRAIPTNLLTCLAFVDPLPFDGVAAFVAYSEAVHASGYVAVILDLAGCGGNLFATTLPRSFSCAQFFAFVRPLIGAAQAPVVLFVGRSTTPHDTQEDLSLEHGQRLTVLFSPALPVQQQTYEKLFDSPRNWLDPDAIPRPVISSGVCLLHRDQRFYIGRRAFPGQSPQAAAAHCIQATEDQVTVGVAKRPQIADLCLHGERCKCVAAVVDIPPPLPVPPARRARTDFFLFLDLRPLGIRPHFRFQHRDTWSISDILMDFFIRLPAGFQLRIQGGQVHNDRLTAASGTTVLFYGVRSTGLSEAGDESPDAQSDEPEENNDNDDNDEEEQDSSSSNANEDEQVRPRSRSPRRYGFAGCALCLHLTGRLIHQPLLHPSLFQVLLASEFAVVSCKILEEPTPYTARQLANLDALRYYAGEFGLEWRYTPAWVLYEQLERCAPIPIPAALPVVAAARLHFEVLVPGYLVERVVLTAVLPAAVDHILQFVQAERDPDSARRFPVLVPAIPQPVSHTGLLVALPAWNPRATVIIIDARALDGRLFAIQAPLYVAKYAILQLAGVPVGAHVTVCFAGDGEPLPLEGEFRVFTGQCFLLLPRNAPTPPPYALDDMLRTPGRWVPASPVLPPDTPDCYCCVTEHGHILHAADSSRPWEYRSEIAAICNVPVGNVCIQPTSPRVQDCQVFGYTCRSVTAVGSNAVNACYVVVDCRPLMQGWNCFSTSGTLDILDVHDDLGAFAPPGWYVRLCEVPEAATTVPVRSGQLFVAEYVQLPPDEDLSDFPWMTGPPPPSGPDDPDTSSDSASENDLPGQDSRLIPGGRDLSNNAMAAGRHVLADEAQDVMWNCGTMPPACTTRPRGDTPFNLERRQRVVERRHRPRVGLFARLPAHVFVACLLQCCPAVVAVGTTGMDAGPRAQLLCKDAANAMTLHRHEMSETDAHFRHRLRTVPTPCRATVSSHPITGVPDIGDLITLLDESAASSHQWAFLASTLLETLFEHFQGMQSQSADKVHISLAEAVPVSSFQADCLSLAQLLPKPATDLAVQPDWLDNDLRTVLHSTVMSLRFRTALVNVRPWHANPSMEGVIAVDIFTDGSASGTEEPLRSAPGSWAFSVWMRKQHESLYYGAAAAVVAPPDTAFFLGEPGDGPLPCETLALCWALTWVIQYGPACRRPIHLWYDCLAAGKGTFGDHKPAHLPACEGYGSLSWFAVVLRQIAQHRVNLTADYVPGHAGYLGNELSDGLAKLARLRNTDSEEPLLPSWPGKLARHPLAAWAWLVDQVPADMPTLYAFEATAGYMQRQVPQTRPAPTMGLSSLPGADSPATFQVRCVSYNVLTLLDKDGRTASRAANAGMRLAGKKHLMTTQLLDAQVLFVGLQETRLQETATLPDRHFTCLHSAATPSGQLGCALWISKCTP